MLALDKNAIQKSRNEACEETEKQIDEAINYAIIKDKASFPIIISIPLNRRINASIIYEVIKKYNMSEYNISLNCPLVSDYGNATLVIDLQ